MSSLGNGCAHLGFTACEGIPVYPTPHLMDTYIRQFDETFISWYHWCPITGDREQREKGVKVDMVSQKLQGVCRVSRGNGDAL